MLDLNLLPVSRHNGQDYPELLGLHFTGPPNRAARGRSQDRLVLYSVLEGNAPLPADQRDQVLSDLAKLYFQTLGSVTAALRLTANEMNRLLLERNRQLGGSRQAIGHLIQVVLRDEQITLSLSGLLHALLVNERGVEEYYEPELAGPGLGLVKAAPLSFIQASLRPNDTLILTTQPAPEWRLDVLKGIHGQGPEGLRRRLFPQTTTTLNAVALQAKQGKGNFYLLRPPSSQSAGETHKETSEAPAEPVLQIQTSLETAVASSTAAQAEFQSQEAYSPAQAAAQTSSKSVMAEQPKPATQPAGQVSKPASAVPAKKKWPIKDWLRKMTDGLKPFLGRMLPGEPFLSIPSGVMAIVAVAVPVIIVTAASTAYFRLGRAVQYELFSTQAKQIASQALEKTDLGAKRADLGTALTLLSKAENYARTPETQADIESMRSQISNQLDELDFVRRVNYQAAIIGGLEVNSAITGMVAFDDELYMLDKTSGFVIRAYLTIQGYEIDYTFNCQPGSYGEVRVGTLNKILAWPSGYKPSAKVLALDTLGNALFCQPDAAPIAQRLAAGGEGNWGDVTTAALDQGDAYILDLLSNGVWIYTRSNFGEPPTLFFDQAIPPLDETIDMLVDRDDLYLLQSDGAMKLCVRDLLIAAPTRCSQRTYVDRRPGRENLELVPTSPFIQITSIPPPDPSLFLLEPKGQAIYHFSLRNLAFQKMFLPEQPLPKRNASAFAINQTRRYLYLALGNQIFYAALP